MNKKQFELILQDSTKADWSYDENDGTLTYKKDQKLKIKSSNYKEQTFDAKWLKLLDDKKAFEENFEIVYDGKIIDSFPVAYVDGRVDMPIPDENMTISDYEYRIASLVDQLGYLNNVMQKCGIKKR